jgi:hypothetical protein
MPSSTTRESNPGQRAHDRPVLLHSLVFLDEGAEVTVGRADVDGYAVLPAEGAGLLRRLEEGLTPGEAADWYERTYSESVDIDGFLDDLAELDFLRDPGEAAHASSPVRWERLGRVVFSAVGGGCLASALIACVIAMLRSPQLVPSYHDLFFTHYMTVLELVLFLGQFPLILLHELAHALAGRRLGLRTRLSIGRRMYYVVFVTIMDGLVTVPRRKRYVPMLAGMLADLLVFSVFILVADLAGRRGGGLSPAGNVALAFAYLTLLRLAWQFFFYLQTDLYYVIVTVLGCVDLQVTARRVLRERLGRARRRPVSPADLASAHPRDLAVARWYSWLLLLGWTASITILIDGVIPAATRVLGTVSGRFTGSGPHSAADLADSIVFVLLNLAQLAVLAAFMLRDRNRRLGPRAGRRRPLN